MSTMSRRDELLRPYARDHAESIARVADRGKEPRSLGEYLVWFERLWWAEMPDELHAAGVWRDRVSGREAQDGITAVGGSLLGSPNLADPFRRLMENSPFETEEAEYEGKRSLDRHYVRPMHAAIAAMGTRWPLAARWMASLAACAFDWQGLATRRGWTHEEAELYLEKCCHILWSRFAEAPENHGYRGVA
jgi:hypothetical protein